jgi:thiamine transporter ThiT
MIVLFSGTDGLRVDNRADANLFILVYFYCWMVMCASPFWLLTFLPLYLAVPSKSFVWGWNVAPLIGLLIGLVGSLIIFGKQDFDYPRDLFFPAAIGFTVFLLGAIFKSSSKAAPLA